MKIEDYWKRGFRFWIRFPVYFVADVLGIMSHWDKYNGLKWTVEVCNKLEELDKKIEALEKRWKNVGRKPSRGKNQSTVC